MKHVVRKIAGAAVAALLCIAPLTACMPSAGIGNARAEIRVNGVSYVVIEVLAGDTSRSLYDALAAFAEQGDIRLDGGETEYGFFVTSVNGREANADYYWAVYTTLGTVNGTAYSDAAYGTWEYDGRTLAMASYGVSGLPLFEDEYYALIWTPIVQSA